MIDCVLSVETGSLVVIVYLDVYEPNPLLGLSFSFLSIIFLKFSDGTAGAAPIWRT